VVTVIVTSATSKGTTAKLCSTWSRSLSR